MVFQLYSKLCCDEEEMLSHAKELLKELGPASPMADVEKEEEEGEGEGLISELAVDASSSEEDGMDVT